MDGINERYKVPTRIEERKLKNYILHNAINIESINNNIFKIKITK